MSWQAPKISQDHRLGYHQIRIAEYDVEMIAFRTRSGSFEYLVMSFGLTVVPRTSCRLGNDLFREFLDSFVIIYIDDILIFSKTFENHLEHLRKIFTILQANPKPEKCEFAMQEIQFLGFIVGKDGLRVDPQKIETVKH